MSRSTEQILLSLMPTQSLPLPTSLVEMASSILAHSKYRASTLKAEEEVARPYACAHIACDRMKTSLNLPPIEPRPPIPPRIYKRLYSYLDKIIPSSALATSSASKLRTPTKPRGSPSTPGSKRLPSRGTPGKEASLSKLRTPSGLGQGTPTKSTGRASVLADEKALHPWIRPTIRFICQDTGRRRLAPTILAGMETIVAPGEKRTKDEWVLDNLAGVLSAIFFCVAQQITKILSGEEVDKASYKKMRQAILASLAKARSEVEMKDLEEDEAWDGYAKVSTKDFDRAVQEVSKRHWLESDWFRGLGDVVRSKGRRDVDADAAEAQEPDEAGDDIVHVGRPDSMLQERYDFLSRERQEDYRIWKAGILSRIQELESAPQPMEVDT